MTYKCPKCSYKSKSHQMMMKHYYKKHHQRKKPVNKGKSKKVYVFKPPVR